MAKGGVRPGSGRKKGCKLKRTLAKEQAAVALEKLIMVKFGPLAETKIRMALGIFKEKLSPDGKKQIVYQSSPDTRSLEWLLERVVGKLKEKTTVDVPPLERLTAIMQKILNKK